MYATLLLLAMFFAPATNPAAGKTHARKYYARKLQHTVNARRVHVHKVRAPKRY